MRCDQAQSLLSDHLNGALAPDEADALEAHLAGCADCRRVLGELRWVAGLLQGVPSAEMPADLGARVHAALDALEDVPQVAPRIPCDEAEDYMSGHLEGDLDEWEARALDAHLDGCADCRLMLDQLRATRVLLRAVPSEPMPAGLAERIHLAIAALPGEGEEPVVATGGCDEAREQLSDHLEGMLAPAESVALNAHLAACAACRLQLTQLEAVRALLRAVPREPLPTGLGERVHAALEALPVEVAAAVGASSAAMPRRRRGPSWPSVMMGAAAAVALFFVWNTQQAKLPTIETAAVSTNTDVAVNIGFDVAQSVDGVTFQVDLPEGLEFVDDKSHPMAAQSVAWRGSLKQGKTVVPVVVRGVRPGRYEIEAYVSKGAMRKKTTIVLPVTGV